MEFKEFDINAPIIQYLKHLDDTIKQQNEHIKAIENEKLTLENEIKIIKDKLNKIKNNPFVKILLKIRRIYLNFLGKNR